MDVHYCDVLGITKRQLDETDEEFVRSMMLYLKMKNKAQQALQKSQKLKNG